MASRFEFGDSDLSESMSSCRQSRDAERERSKSHRARARVPIRSDPIRSEPVGTPVPIEGGSQCTLATMAECCSFVITLHGFPSTPVLGLDLEMQFLAHLRQVTFPTPFVFSDLLSAELTPFQTRSQARCVAPPLSTSQFALDEPLHIILCICSLRTRIFASP
jgi:hypothetical protein